MYIYIIYIYTYIKQSDVAEIVYTTALHHTAANCSTLQHTAAHCNTLQQTALFVAGIETSQQWCITYHNYTFLNITFTLLITYQCCSMLQWMTLQHCNTLQ